MLHGVWDPLIYSTVSGLLIVVVLAASFVLAWGRFAARSEDRDSAGVNQDRRSLASD